jgi:hypothetical protein
MTQIHPRRAILRSLFCLSVTDHPKAATANPWDFYDNHFLNELESSGFVKELYSTR